MKKIGEIRNFNGRFGVIMTNQEEFDFHISDISASEQNQKLESGMNVEFRAEYRPPQIKRAKNIKILEKKVPSEKTFVN